MKFVLKIILNFLIIFSFIQASILNKNIF